MIETTPIVAEDVQSAQVGAIIVNNFTDEEFAKALVSLISKYLGHLKAMNDQVSSHELTLEERPRQFASKENEVASTSHDIQCERGQDYGDQK